MLASELANVPYNKAAHRRALITKLQKRSEQSVEFKHANISAVLIDLGFPYITGYKPRSNYQQLLFDVVAERLRDDRQLLRVADADVDAPVVVPEVDDILSILTSPPATSGNAQSARESTPSRPSFAVNYLEREAHNRLLGEAGEQFAINFERARLIHAGKERLAAKIEHTSKVRGDAAGFDVLSFEESGAERFIEVKTTKYGRETPFFLSRNEVDVSQAEAGQYHLYRLFGFRTSPQMFMLPGALSQTCRLSASTFLAVVK